MSPHELSPELVRRISAFADRLDQALQAEAYAVRRGQAVHPAFDPNYIASDLQRALIAHLAWEFSIDPVVGHGLEFRDLGSGGWSIVLTDPMTHRRVGFQSKICDVDNRGDWVATTNASSFLAQRLSSPRPPKGLFDGDDYDNELVVPPVQRFDAELWLLMSRIDRETRTFARMAAARPVGLLGTCSPHRLALDDITTLGGAGGAPPVAFPKTDDPLFPGGAGEEVSDDEGAEGEAGAG